MNWLHNLAHAIGFDSFIVELGRIIEFASQHIVESLSALGGVIFIIAAFWYFIADEGGSR